MVMVHCRECGKEIADTAPTCPHCGARQKAASAGETKTLNWIATLILSILFGWFGVDRFMMGQIGLGILKLITGGGVGVWWLIDWIMIAAKHKFKDVEWV